MRKGFCKVVDRKRAAALLFGVLAAAYLFCSPGGAVRLAVAASGHPVAAVTCTVESGFVYSTPDGGVRPYHVETPPVERATDSVLRNWAVHRTGPFFTAEYWGYC